MSFILGQLAWKGGPTKSARRFVYIALCQKASDSGDSCFPSIRTIARMTAQTRRNIFNVLPQLADGWITIKPSTVRGSENQYLIDVPRLCRSVITSGEAITKDERIFIDSVISGEEIAPGEDFAPSEQIAPSEKSVLGVVKNLSRGGEKSVSLYRKKDQERSLERTGVYVPSDEDAERVWRPFPNHKGSKSKAIVLIKKALTERAKAGVKDPVQDINDRVGKWNVSRLRGLENGFVPSAPHATTFFNGAVHLNDEAWITPQAQLPALSTAERSRLQKVGQA